MQPVIYIIIATALNRTEWLLRRSLLSVYKQEGIDVKKVQVLIVDDNENEDELAKIKAGITNLKIELGLSEKEFPTRAKRNQRTRFMSGTGAWNTGIFLAFEENPLSFISILDDDDEYLPHHLSDCIQKINAQPELLAVFQELVWQLPDGNFWNFPLSKEDITPENFYIGNPGIQGSNMFIQAKELVAFGAFDETFESTTDRDLMIRFLCHLKNEFPFDWQTKFSIITQSGVIHHFHLNERVTNNSRKKHNGLDSFYTKFKQQFSEAQYQKSLKRAAVLFEYNTFNTEKACIAILMAMRNNADTIHKAIESVINQKATKRQLNILVSDDNSTDNSYAIVEKLTKEFPNIHLYKGDFNSAAKNRNHLQELVKANFPDCILIGRLDADDTLHQNDILQQIEQLWEETKFDALLMANHQLKGDEYTGYTNKPSNDLLNPDVLIDRLKLMAQGVWEAELPSCNLFLNPEVAIPFAEINSAEDHRNLVDYLIKADELNLLIKPDWIYCNYRIDKHLNAESSKKNVKSKARKELYKYALTQVADKPRKTKAKTLLQNRKPGNYHYLGAGFSGVVFHDNEWVYKVHLPLSTNNFNEVDNILFLKAKLPLFNYRRHFYPLKEITLVGQYYVLVYPYEKSESVTSLNGEDMISFLAEMWQMKVICRSITKENNFIRVNGAIKLIDYEIESYSDNLFLNCAARAFIQLNDFEFKNTSYHKLKRSTINNFSLPELIGFDKFVSEIFERCALQNFPLSITSHSLLKENATQVLYNGDTNPSVSLLIKACVQDSATLYHDVSILVTQLTQSVTFSKKCLLLDLYKEKNFLRQYSNQGSKKELLEVANRLKEDGIVDLLIIPPDDNASIEEINRHWFGIISDATHTAKGVPVSSQLFAFEQAPGDFILQMDVDVLIGLKDPSFDYLKGMIAALNENEQAVSIGFQIYHNHEIKYQPIIGQDGSIAPDVRCCFLHKKRLLFARPFTNTCSENGWELSWYRALEKHQKNSTLVSLRGGDTCAFYIHPQNYRKQNRWVWHTIQQGVKHAFIPEKQMEQAEVAGNIFDWCLPKRHEDLVVILYADKLNKESLQKSIQTLIGQDLNDYGLVIINNTGDEKFTSTFRQPGFELYQRTTVIDFEQSISYNEAVYKAIHYYLANTESFVCLMIQGDVLLYPAVLSESMNRLQIYQADVLIGKEISSRTLAQTGMSRSNFLHPRSEPDTLSNGLAMFRKYLFDSLSHLDMKTKVSNSPSHIPAFSKIKQTHRWLHDVSNISILTPIVELSHNPIRFDHINVLRNYSISDTQIAEVTQFVQMGKPKQEGAWEKSRKTFLPNTNKIELDITYDCNLKCFHCNRSCTQAPTETHMTLQQVQQFVQESVAMGKQWELINVLGGEPTLHPQFADIVHCLLYDYLIPHSPNTTLQITSNGHGEQVQQKLAALPTHPNLVVDYNSFKDDRAVPYFTPFNLAPADEPDAHLHEYHKGCWVTAYCGIGLNHLGYFACGVAGGIERILKAGKGIQSQEELDERLIEQLNTYCRLCGNFTAYAENRGDFMERAEKDSAPKTAMSESWKKLYKQHNHENA